MFPKGLVRNKKSPDSKDGLKSPLEDTLFYATEAAKESVGAEGSGVMFYEPDSRMISLQYPAMGSPREIVTQYKVPVNGTGVAVKTFNTMEPFFTNDCSRDPVVIHKYAEMYGVKKLLSVPLEHGGNVFGVWHVSNKIDSDWEEQDVNRFTAIAKCLSGIIEQARHWHLRERRHQVWLSLMQKMAGSGDMQSVAEVLAHALGSPLLVVDRWGRCRASVSFSSGNMEVRAESIKYLCRLNLQNGLVRILPSLENHFSNPVWIRPLGTSGKTAGYLLVLAGEEQHFDEVLLDQAALVLAVGLNSEDRLTEMIERLSSDFLDRLAGGMLKDDEAYMRAGRIGLDLRCGWTLALAVPDSVPASNDKIQNLWLKMHIARDFLWRELENLRQECWLGVLGDCSMTVLIKQPAGESVVKMPKELPHTIRQVLRRYAGGMTFSIGIGEMVCEEPAHYAEAFREARQTVEIGRKLNGYGQVTYCRDLGANLLLYETGHSAASKNFGNRLINRLVEHDKKHGSQLVETLEAFLEAGGNIAAAARVMHTHVNTVRYRLARVEELTGRSLKSNRNRFEFQLILQIKKLRD